MIWTENPPAAVLVAKQFNPSVVSQIWLARQGILDADGKCEDGSIFSDTIVQALTPDFVLLLFMEQLQFILKAPPERQKKLIQEKLGKLVHELPHIPYRAVGLNFNWHLTPTNEDIQTLTRRLFAVPSYRVFERFGDVGARFGAYMSRDVGDFRLKLDIKPIRALTQDGVEEERLQFSFNFHVDVSPSERAAETVVSHLACWDLVRQEAVDTVMSAGFEPNP